MIGLIVLFILLIIIFAIWNFASYLYEDMRFITLIFIILLSVCLGIVIKTNSNTDKPDAIDVYRGNTQLEITETVRDSVVVSRDTVVVFRMK